MDLSDFIKETLCQLAKGIKDSQDAVRELGGISSPAFYTEHKADTSTLIGLTSDHRQVYFIDFDVSVTVSQEKTGDYGGKLKVGIVSVNGERGDSASSNATNKIMFRIPFSPPLDETTLREKRDKEEKDKQSNRRNPAALRREL